MGSCWVRRKWRFLLRLADNTDPNAQIGIGGVAFYANYGIPAQQCIVQQIYPDYYVNMVQQQFAGYFASLAITKVDGADNPTYNIDVVFYNGTSYRTQVPVWEMPSISWASGGLNLYLGWIKFNRLFLKEIMDD